MTDFIDEGRQKMYSRFYFDSPHVIELKYKNGIIISYYITFLEIDNPHGAMYMRNSNNGWSMDEYTSMLLSFEVRGNNKQ